MKVVIVNCFDTYEDRVELIERFFRKKGHDVKILTADFMHFQKAFRCDPAPNRIFIETRPYYRNLSVARMYSHWCFACKVTEELLKYHPDLVYALVPPNSLVKKMAEYKEENPHIKLIFDVIDLWPEALPIPLFKNLFPFKIWMNLRNKYLKAANYVITECELYQHRLGEYLKKTRSKTVCLAREKKHLDICDKTSGDKIALCYLGSINNVIDIDLVGDIISQIAAKTKVELHIIGDGENKATLINAAQKKGAEVYDYGSMYDPLEKQRIFNMCDYGLNIMKKSVCVGLTMKSVDYLEGGLPLINNIQGDTWSFVDQYHVGINYKAGEELDLEPIEKAHVRAFFEERFADKVFEENMQTVYDEVV